MASILKYFRKSILLIGIALSPAIAPRPIRAQSIDPAVLTKASETLRQAVASGDIAGATYLVWHRGKVVHFDAVGFRDIEDQLPMQRETLVRIYSMTKPITSVTAMTLYERGKFDLDDPVAKFIPAFADAKVYTSKNGQLATATLDRPISVRDVFRHTAGYGYDGGNKPGLSAVYRQKGMNYGGPNAMHPPEMSIQDAAEALAGIPTHHQPGQRFTYGFNTDLLGRLIEVWSGKPLDVAMREAVLDPLEMNDTSFRVPDDKRDRLASVHTDVNGKLVVVDKGSSSPFQKGFEFLSGGGGLISSIDDYAKFCEMIVGGGQRNGARVLKPETLSMMLENHLEQAAGDFQFGLGFAINPTDIGSGKDKHRSKEVWWAGYASTDFRVVPDEQFFQIFFRQRVPSKHQLARKTFRQTASGIRLDGKPDPTSASDTASQETSAGSADWTGWLGPNRDGWVESFKPPKTWPRSLVKQWQMDVGSGYGTPLVVDRHIFQHARVGDEEVVWCLDLDSGKTLWRQSMAVAFKMGGGGEPHGKGPKSNPFYSNGRLFTFSITGVLSAWNAADGELLWQRDRADDFQPTHPYWGHSTSPIADENRVFVHFGNDGNGVLVAHDVATGEVLWEQGNDGASYSSPLIAQWDGVRQLVEWNHRALAGIDLKTGKKLWEQPFAHEGTNQNMPTPSIHEGCILVGGENRGFYSFRPQSKDGRWTVEERWFQDSVALDMSSAVINDGRLYGFSHYDRGRLFCLDPDDGSVIWEGPPRSGSNVTFLAFPGHVAALMNDGHLKVLKAGSDQFHEIADYTVAETETWAAPVLLQDGVLVKDKGTLTRWKIR